MKKNETVTVKRKDLIEVLEYLNQIVVSIDRIGSYSIEVDEKEQDKILLEFFDKWKVWKKLSKARSILDKYFSYALGDDDMCELEREFQNLEYWSSDYRKPKKTLSRRRKKMQKDNE